MSRTITKKTTVTYKPGSINGLREVAPISSPYWHTIYNNFNNISSMYGFQKVEVPIIEEGKVYSDFYKDQKGQIEKTLFTQLGNKPTALRSVLLPSVLRHYSQQALVEENPLAKWFYFGNVVEQDARQALHSNYQYGYEVMGEFNHLTEAQTISAVWDMLNKLGLADVSLEINTIGDINCQNNYQGVLKDFLKNKEFDLCDNCNADVRTKPLAVLRCDNLDCQVIATEAPAILDFLDEGHKKHFMNILEALDELGLPYQLNSTYIGPEGASKTNVIFKYKTDKETIVLGEGTHHDILVKNVVGKAAPAFGFAGMLSNLIKAMEHSTFEVEQNKKTDVFLVPLGELASKKSLRLFRDLINANIRVHDHFGMVGVKNQLKLAELFKAPLALIMGQKEAMDEMVILRDVKSGMQEVFSYDKIIDEVKKRLDP